MSYDLYCYKPTSDVPKLNEAEALIEEITEADESGIAVKCDSTTRDEIAAALRKHNPRLEKFDFDYGKIAFRLKISENAARARFQHIELTPPRGDLAIQLTVHHDHVFISVPYWYKGTAADHVFSALSAYLRVIRETAGFFVYDPQSGVVFDPQHSDLENHHEYDQVVAEMPRIAAGAGKQTKPWWRFW
jgi:hypothetical protein